LAIQVERIRLTSRLIIVQTIVSTYISIPSYRVTIGS
jgi:hypothetical protein